MSYINYPSSSPYSITPQLNWRMGLYKDRPIPAARDDIRIPKLDAKYHNRPDQLSNDLYGTPNYYWVFMRRNLNTIRDPIFDLRAGMSLIAPSLTNIQGTLS
jgi:hypothetical protein